MAMMGSGTATGEERARAAAESAIASPLLEDVNLAGARGILVNITAGINLSIGEFDTVGNTVKEFASDDATVVVGTVIDENMSDELRVTVVATGLGARQKMAKEPPVKLVQQAVGAEVDFRELERPTVIRKQAAEDTGRSSLPGDLEYLDIPAFLRRQAD